MPTMLFGGLTIPPAAVLNSTASRARQLAAAGARSAVPLTYGEDRLGALILNVLPAGADSAQLLVQCLWGFACDSVLDLRLNDIAVPSGTTVTHYTGNQITVDAGLAAAFAAKGLTYSDTLSGYAYSVVSMPIRAFDGQLGFTARVRGRKVYDVRKDSTAGGSGAHRLADPSTWEWSDCPALCLADFVASTLYGMGRPVLWAGVGAVANANDATVGSPAEKHRVVGVSFTSPAPVADIAETLRAYAGCFLVGGPAGVGLLADADASAVASYAHASGDIAAIGDLVKADIGNIPTVVEVIYSDTSQIPWRDASAVAQMSGAGTTRPWRLSQVRMPGVQRYSQANREAIERLNKLTLSDLSCSLEVFDVGIRHEVGDIINVTHPVGLSAKPMRVMGCDMPGAGRWQLDLAEHDAAAYSTVVATRPTNPDTGFVNPAGPPSSVTGFSAVAEEIGVRLRWDANAEVDVSEYELRQGGASWGSAAPLDGSLITIVGGTTHLWVQPTAGTYTLRIKALDNEGLQSSADTVTSIVLASSKLSGIAPGATANATFVQAGTPTALAAGDLWWDSANGYKLYRATAPGVASWIAYSLNTDAFEIDAASSYLSNYVAGPISAPLDNTWQDVAQVSLSDETFELTIEASGIITASGGGSSAGEGDLYAVLYDTLLSTIANIKIGSVEGPASGMKPVLIPWAIKRSLTLYFGGAGHTVIAYIYWIKSGGWAGMTVNSSNNFLSVFERKR